MLDWTQYNQFDWTNSKQHPMDQSQRAELEVSTAELLGLSNLDRQSNWGACSPPGRFAQTVVRISTTVSHRFETQALDQKISEIGVKLFKTTADAQRESRKVINFCREQIHQLPGLPNEHIQRTIEAGTSKATMGQRNYVVQEWVSGESLEDCIRRRWPNAPISKTIARSVIEQLIGQIVIPMWSVGTVWWDFRDANFCWDDRNDKLMMIDIDSLAAYADEILSTPDVWTRRDKGRRTALARLYQMTLRILLAQDFGAKSKVALAFKEAWSDQLENALLNLGQHAQYDPAASLQGFLDRLERTGLLGCS